MPSATGRSSSFSTPPKGPRRWPTAARSGGPPSCIKCRITPLFRGRLLRRKESKPISGVTSRSVRCRVISSPAPTFAVQKVVEPQGIGSNREGCQRAVAVIFLAPTPLAAGNGKGHRQRDLGGAREPRRATEVGDVTVAGREASFCPRSGFLSPVLRLPRFRNGPSEAEHHVLNQVAPDARALDYSVSWLQRSDQ